MKISEKNYRYPWPGWLKETEEMWPKTMDLSNPIIAHLADIVRQACRRGAIIEDALAKKGVQVPNQIWDPADEQLCEWCGLPFVKPTKVSTQKYCSPQCAAIKRAKTKNRYGTAKRAKVTMLCVECKKPFVKSNWNHKLCGRPDCDDAYREKGNAARRKVPQLHDRHCEECKKPFTSARRSTRFCSRKCNNKNHGDRYKKLPQTRSCDHCGKTMAARSTCHIYCGSLCSDRSRRLRNKKVFTEIECKKCGDKFLPRAKNHTVCSNKCRASRNHTGQPTVACAECQTLFPRTANTQLYCGLDCREIAKAARVRERYHAKKAKERTTKLQSHYPDLTPSIPCTSLACDPVLVESF